MLLQSEINYNPIDLVCNEELCSICNKRFICLTDTILNLPNISISTWLKKEHFLKEVKIQVSMHLFNDPFYYNNLFISSSGRHRDWIHGYTCKCGWEGFVAEAIHGYIRSGKDDVEPSNSCPWCGRQEDFLEYWTLYNGQP